MKMKKIKKFEELIIEDAVATAGNSNGMGDVVAANPSSTPGDVAGSTIGSGDIGHKSFEPFEKPQLKLKKKKKKNKKKKKKNIKKFNNFKISNENNETDNFTARYYDDFDDEEEMANELDLQEFNPKNRKIQLFEEFKDKVTYEMTGSPKPFFNTKSDFISAMKDWGYTHTTLNKNTDMLIARQEDLDTLKCQKAEKYGIPIYTYEDAFNKKEKLYTKVIRKKRLKNLSNI